jgi:hypothetical protein
MKRLAIAFLLLFPVAAFAFDPSTEPPRVAVLRQPEPLHHDGDNMVSDAVLRYVTEELRERGLDAFDAGVTYDEAVDQNYGEADYVIEIASDADGRDYGGMGVGGRHGGVGMSILVARVAAEVRVYDGHTFQLIDRQRLQHRNRALLPTSLSLGGRAAWIGVAVPIAQTVQFRNVAKAAARSAATFVTQTLARQ